MEIDLDPLTNPFLTVDELHALGFGDRKTIRQAIARGEIPVRRTGRTYKIPTAWARREMQLDPPAEVPR
jgi:excisionase family DNA binding protein